MDYVKRYYWQSNDVSELGYGCMYDEVEWGTIALVPAEAFDAELANRKHWMELSSENQCRAASERDRADAGLELCREAMSRFTGTTYDARVEELLNELTNVHNALCPPCETPIVIGNITICNDPYQVVSSVNIETSMKELPAALRIGSGVTVENIGFGPEQERKPYLVFANNGDLTEVNLIDVSLASKRRTYTLAELTAIGVQVEQPAPVAAEYELHMGEAMRVFDALKFEKIDRKVDRAELGPIGALVKTTWSTKIGVTLEMQDSMGGCTLIVRTPMAPIVLPDRMEPRDEWDPESNQWNACLDELKRLNPSL